MTATALAHPAPLRMAHTARHAGGQHEAWRCLGGAGGRRHGGAKLHGRRAEGALLRHMTSATLRHHLCRLFISLFAVAAACWAASLVRGGGPEGKDPPADLARAAAHRFILSACHLFSTYLRQYTRQLRAPGYLDC